MQPENPFIYTLSEWTELFMRRSMRNFILYSKESGLSMSQLGALFHLKRKGSSDVSDVGDELGVTSAAASQMLERLVQQDLVVRSEDPTDRRVKNIIITEKGRIALQASIRARQSWLGELDSLLSPSEKEQVIAALNILIAKVRDLDQAPLPEH